MKSKSAIASKSTKVPTTEQTNVEIDDDGVLYIRIIDCQGPPASRERQMEKIKDAFEKMLPDTKIIVGIHDLHFSTITKKQEFIGRLDGQIKKSASK